MRPNMFNIPFYGFQLVVTNTTVHCAIVNKQKGNIDTVQIKIYKALEEENGSLNIIYYGQT